MMLVVLEGIIMCFVLLIICVVGIANGPEGMVFFYEKEVQDKAVELGQLVSGYQQLSDFRYWRCSLPGLFQDFNF